MPTRNATKSHTNASRKKTNGRKTVRSSSRKRAALADQSDKVIPGRRHPAEPSVIVLMSERLCKGENIPRVPAVKVRNTRSAEPKGVPQTGMAKRRKRT